MVKRLLRATSLVFCCGVSGWLPRPCPHPACLPATLTVDQQEAGSCRSAPESEHAQRDTVPFGLPEDHSLSLPRTWHEEEAISCYPLTSPHHTYLQVQGCLGASHSGSHVTTWNAFLSPLPAEQLPSVMGAGDVRCGADCASPDRVFTSNHLGNPS